jgi:hypothetical protein
MSDLAARRRAFLERLLGSDRLRKRDRAFVKSLLMGGIVELSPRQLKWLKDINRRVRGE